MNRRDFATTLAAGLAATGIASAQAPAPAVTPVKRKNRIKQGCMRTNFPNTMSFDDMCRIAAERAAAGVSPDDETPIDETLESFA